MYIPFNLIWWLVIGFFVGPIIVQLITHKIFWPLVLIILGFFTTLGLVVSQPKILLVAVEWVGLILILNAIDKDKWKIKTYLKKILFFKIG